MLQSPDFCGVFQFGSCFQNFLEFVFLGNRTHDLFFFFMFLFSSTNLQTLLPWFAVQYVCTWGADMVALM